MTVEAWTAIGTGVVIHIAMAAPARHLRSEIHAARVEHREDLRDLREPRERLEAALRECIGHAKPSCANAWVSSKPRCAGA